MGQPIANAHVRCVYCNRRITITLGTLRRIADGLVWVVCSECEELAIRDGWIPVCECEICSGVNVQGHACVR